MTGLNNLYSLLLQIQSAKCCQVVDDQPEQPWFNNMLYAAKEPLTFDELMATPIDFSNFAKNRLKLDKITKVDLENLEGNRCPFDLSKTLPLKGHPCHLTVAAEYFFNNDLEYLKSTDSERKYTTSITKMRLDLVRGALVCSLGSSSHERVEDVQLGVESYQKKLNITKPQKDFLRISAKEPYTPSFEPPRVVYEDLSHRKRLMRADELYKFSDGTLKKVHDTLHHRLHNF
ncbi:hypothetical protein Tco_0329191 [Tanacetum coccineum]